MIYLQIAIPICICFTVVGYFTEKKIKINPLSLFCALWAIILFFSSLEEYTMYRASDEINFMILIGIIAYIIGYYFNKIFLQKIHFCFGKYSHYRSDILYNAIPRYQFLYALCIISILYTLYTFFNTIRQSGTFNLGIIQSMLQSGDIVSSNGPLINAIALLVIAPFKFVIPAITAVDFWFGRRDKKLLYMTIALITINMLSSANRTSFLLFFVWLLVVTIIYLYHIRLENRKKYDNYFNRRIISQIRKYKKYIVIVAIVAFVLMSVSRGVSSFVRQFYLYFSMSPRMFEIWAEKVEQSNIYGYGVASMLGFIYPLFYVIKNLLGIEMPQLVQSMYDWTMQPEYTWVYPGRNIYANAYVSVFWNLYVDGRIIGIIIGMLVLGIIASRSFSNIIAKTYSARQIAVYCCVFYVILFSFVRFQFTLSRIALAFIFVMFFAYKFEPKETGVIKI